MVDTADNGVKAAEDNPVEPAATHAVAAYEVSIVIVSFNTRDLLRECLKSVMEETASIPAEILVVDNASRDGSAEMVKAEFPQVRLFRSKVNLGFGNANNAALEHAKGRYHVLLNSDAFFKPGALARAIDHMDRTPRCALGGGLLVGRDDERQPSARCFHSIRRDAIVLTGLAAKFPKSRLFGSFDRTWADPAQPSSVDWVPGAFAILRPEALKRTGFFDPDFFLYYEEVDLCLRMKKAGYDVWYWPDVVIIHLGGESSKNVAEKDISSPATQVTLWRMRSALLYYRKHMGWQVHLARLLENTIYRAGVLRNQFSSNPRRKSRAVYYRSLITFMNKAWADTRQGRVSPPRPW